MYTRTHECALHHPCAQALLDLEGNSLTPILVSLVKKDASMLDAFGKVRV